MRHAELSQVCAREEATDLAIIPAPVTNINSICTTNTAALVQLQRWKCCRRAGLGSNTHTADGMTKNISEGSCTGVKKDL